RLEMRENDGVNPPSQSDPLIHLIENYSPTGETSSSADASALLVTNQVTNPQFADINFFSGLTLTAVANPDPIDIGPGWTLELTGTRNATIELTPLTSATPNPTNAPYALRINVTGGWTSAQLRQRFDQAGMLWSEKFVTGSVTARIDGASRNLVMSLVDSLGTPLGVVFT